MTSGEAFFELDERRGTSKVVFGPVKMSLRCSGALTLESLGLMVNPVTRENLADALVPRLVSRSIEADASILYARALPSD